MREQRLLAPGQPCEDEDRKEDEPEPAEDDELDRTEDLLLHMVFIFIHEAAARTEGVERHAARRPMPRDRDDNAVR